MVPANSMMLSIATTQTSVAAPKTMRIPVVVQGRELLFLIDSGSSTCFIDSQVAAELNGVQKAPISLKVKVAGGELLDCSEQVTDMKWSTHGCEFVDSFRVLDLRSYDGIVGLDWLAKHSPMLTHWEEQWIAIVYAGTWTVLYGGGDNQQANAVVELQFVHDNIQPEQELFNEDIQSLLDQFEKVFAEPTGLPPRRQYDHQIPLIPGARPVSVRPYRVVPELKTEIEKQVAELLRQGIITHSTSPFSSPVLLVRKDGNAWRLVVDFRWLNALTMKGKYPLPVIDELLDELAGSQWFSKLDLPTYEQHLEHIKTVLEILAKEQWQVKRSKCSFSQRKTALITAPVLALPDFTKPFTVETDACDVGIGAVLSQQNHPVAFVSRPLGPRNRGLSVYEKEYLAILLAVEQWRPYLQLGEFVIRTDHKSLTHLTDQRLHTDWQKKALTKLMGLQYTVAYKKGILNGAADALSRKPVDSSEVFTVSVIKPVWVESVEQSYEGDAHVQSIIQKLAIDPKSEQHYTFKSGLLSANPQNWSRWLSLCEHWYNTNWHASLGKSPFEVLYGRQPRYFGISASDSISPLDVQLWLKERELVMDSVRQHLLRMQQRMKNQADKHRTERVFSVGDMVFLKLQPYVQSSVERRASHKLAFKFFGPYSVVERIGAVTYKLQLPPGSRIHPVFHVSQLKPCLGPGQQVLPHLPLPNATMQVPVRELRRRVRQKGHRTIVQVLIQWSGASEDMATWEDLESLKQKFPRAPAWGQAGNQAGEDVSDQGHGGTASSPGPEESQELGRGPQPKRRQVKPARYVDPAWTS
ncbi:hypothetical protein QYE76_012570 [Lolium multiflorum]|uniref:Chromo domain-containing protein n=1 Tax=Lolium multiflorum TaxID=4521 RepID=A0AAD8U0V0_LOLMU|nr:hypothetical protein QYE76_012570 [Lolium multiflorum]